MNKLLVLAVTITYVAAQGCPSTGTSFLEWEERGDSCYYFVNTPVTWFEADQYCTYLNPGFVDTHLLAIDSAEEQQWLQNFISGRPELRSRNFWTSGNTIDRRLGWTWASTGRQFSYANWAPGEPNRSGNCAQIWGEYNYQWDDADCWGQINFICEYKKVASTTSAPGTTVFNA